MNITVENKRFLPKNIMTESEIDQGFNDVFAILESVQLDSDIYDILTENATLDSYYVEDAEKKETKKNIFERIGEGIMNAINRLIDLISGMFAKEEEDVWKDKSDIDKIQDICDKYPAFSDQVVAMVDSGDIDMGSVHEMSDFITQFDKLRKMTDNPVEEPKGFKKIVKTIGDKLEGFNSGDVVKIISEGGKVIKGVNTIAREGKKFRATSKKMLDGTLDFLQKAGAYIPNLPDKLMRSFTALMTSAPQDKLKNVWQIMTSSTYDETDYAGLGLDTFMEGKAVAKSGAIDQSIPNTSTAYGEKRVNAKEVLVKMIINAIVKIVTNLYNKAVAFFNKIVQALKNREKNYITSRSIIATASGQIAKLIDKRGGIENVIKDAQKGIIELPANVNIVGTKLIIDAYSSKRKERAYNVQ